jgi:tetratricopeptide (TPR) repeat protein
MKKFIVILVIVVAVAAGLYYTFTDESYDYYRRAKVLYEQGNYIEANELLEEGLRINQLNRKIISLKGKVYPIVEGNRNYEEAEKLYQESVNLALEGKSDAAKIAMSKAYDLAFKVSASSLVKEKADDLIRRIERDAPLVLESAPDTQLRNAQRHESEGNLNRAYEVLNNIDIKNEKIKRKMSDIAYRLGERRYKQINDMTEPNEHFITDAIYWYSQVQPFDDNYLAADSRISELKLLNSN